MPLKVKSDMILLTSRVRQKLEIVKERGEPACGRAANYGGLFLLPAVAKNVQANLRIVRQRRFDKFPASLGASLLASAGSFAKKLKGFLESISNF